MTLDGRGSIDPDGSIASYAWSQTAGPAVTLSNAGTASPTFTAPAVDTNTVLAFSLTVTDNRGLASATADTVDVTVLPAPAGGQATISGRVTFERVPFRSTPGTGLDYTSIVPQPSRGITVQAVDTSSGQILAVDVTDDEGMYLVSVPANSRVRIRAVAEMVRTAPETLPHWQVRVRDVDLDAPPYSYEDASTSILAAGSVTHDVKIPSGWAPSSRQPEGPRHAAPFAILDTVYQALRFVADTAPDMVFPELTIDWSTTNGDSNTFYTRDPVLGSMIVLAGEANVDTDEYDQHVIAHEFGHYIEDRFSRSDNLGGPHAVGDRLDLRVAFGEGFGYAFAAMVLNDPLVRDSFGQGQAADGLFDIELDSSLNEGWFSEASVQEILWDLFDAGSDANDSVSLGFGPLWQVLTGPQRETDAVTSLFSFITRLKEQQGAAVASAIDAIVSGELVNPDMDIFASTETHAGTTPDKQHETLPVYRTIAIDGGPHIVTSTANYGGTYNKLSNHRLLKLDVPSQRNVRILVTGPAGRDVDFQLFRRGLRAALDLGPGDEDHVLTLAPGTYILDAYDCNNADVFDFAPEDSFCEPRPTAAVDIVVEVRSN